MDPVSIVYPHDTNDMHLNVKKMANELKLIAYLILQLHRHDCATL